MNRRLLSEIMQSVYSRHDGRERCRDLRIGCVCVVLLSVYKIRMNRRVKSLLHLAPAVHAKTGRLKPRREFFKIRFLSPKSLSELRGRKPGMEFRRGFVLLRG